MKIEITEEMGKKITITRTLRLSLYLNELLQREMSRRNKSFNKLVVEILGEKLLNGDEFVVNTEDIDESEEDFEVKISKCNTLRELVNLKLEIINKSAFDERIEQLCKERMAELQIED